MLRNKESETSTSHISHSYTKRDADGYESKDIYHYTNKSFNYMKNATWELVRCALLKSAFHDLSHTRVLDVGCGRGEFLRWLLERGASGHLLYGTEIMKNRHQEATLISPSVINYSIRDISKHTMKEQEFDLVTSHTVFSSILENKDRKSLANAMLFHTKPGGYIMIFDFRYNNPSNPDVRKVTKKELLNLFPNCHVFYKTGILAPPLYRHLTRGSFWASELLTIIFPFLRTHFVFMAQKKPL